MKETIATLLNERKVENQAFLPPQQGRDLARSHIRDQDHGLLDDGLAHRFEIGRDQLGDLVLDHVDVRDHPDDVHVRQGVFRVRQEEDEEVVDIGDEVVRIQDPLQDMQDGGQDAHVPHAHFRNPLPPNGE